MHGLFFSTVSFSCRRLIDREALTLFAVGTQVQRLCRPLFFRFLLNGSFSCTMHMECGYRCIASHETYSKWKTEYFKFILKSLRVVLLHGRNDNLVRNYLTIQSTECRKCVSYANNYKQQSDSNRRDLHGVTDHVILAFNQSTAERIRSAAEWSEQTSIPYTLQLQITSFGSRCRRATIWWNWRELFTKTQSRRAIVYVYIHLLVRRRVPATTTYYSWRQGTQLIGQATNTWRIVIFRCGQNN